MWRIYGQEVSQDEKQKANGTCPGMGGGRKGNCSMGHAGFMRSQRSQTSEQVAQHTHTINDKEFILVYMFSYSGHVWIDKVQLEFLQEIPNELFGQPVIISSSFTELDAE